MSWFVESFGARYRQLYSHRDEAEAERAVELLEPDGSWRGRVILDLACGAGRYCRTLRRQGAATLGIDLSPVLIAEAHLAEPGADYLRADMRQIPLREKSVDDCLSMFTSFGYFDSLGDHAALAAEMARVSRERIVLDLANPRVLARSLILRSERELEGLLVRETRWLEDSPKRVCKRTELLNSQDEVMEEYEERVMLFELDQLSEFFEPHEFALERCYGSYGGEEFDRDESSRQLCVFSREKR